MEFVGGYVKIIWPGRYLPEKMKVHVSNELHIGASPKIVWAWLVRADIWPTWYLNSKDVVVMGGGTLKLGSSFSWKTFGASLQSKVEEFVPEERLAWSASGFGIEAYHAWLIQPEGNGCHVLTEEVQNGLVARLSSLLRPHNMKKYHQIWLDALKEKAEGGMPET